MNITIRQATPQDANSIAPLVYDAIGDIANRLTGENEPEAILTTLASFVARTDNRHSYLYTYIAENEQDTLGIAVLYDGIQGKALDAQLQKFLAEEKNAQLAIDVEAHDDEFYIDTVCVVPSARGLGIGTKLLQYAEQLATEQDYAKISLNVELEKLQARQLYERLGYVITEPWTIINEPFHHMVKALKE